MIDSFGATLLLQTHIVTDKINYRKVTKPAAVFTKGLSLKLKTFVITLDKNLLQHLS